MPEIQPDAAKDLELARQVALGSKISWDALVDSYAPLIRGTALDYLSSLTGKASEKEIGRLTVEFFKSLVAGKFEKIRNYTGASSLGSYLAVLAVEFIQNYVREEYEKSRFANICKDQAGLLWCRTEKEQAVESSGLEPVLEEALRTLHPHEAIVIRLFYFQSFEYEEISAILHMNMGSVTKTLQAARSNLSKELSARGRRIEEFLY